MRLLPIFGQEGPIEAVAGTRYSGVGLCLIKSRVGMEKAIWQAWLAGWSLRVLGRDTGQV
ncbi:MAG: hypothetical protein A2Y38_14865 [Spirochaetes bacterium GWB1_59_5]|nr:MAG: hypothetical protein A2Y38_14865 [Spirochaetes bacterium GWB1_59_5]